MSTSLRQSVQKQFKDVPTISGAPPENSNPNVKRELFSKLLKRGRVGQTVWFKLAAGETVNIRMQVLTPAELNEAEIETLQWLRKNDIPVTTDVTHTRAFNDRLVGEILSRAMYNPEPVKDDRGIHYYPEFYSADEVREYFIASEVSELWDLYDSTRASYEPDYTSMIADNFDRWVEFLATVGEEDATSFLARLGSVLPALCRMMALEIHSINQSLILQSSQVSTESNPMSSARETISDIVSQLESQKKQERKQRLEPQNKE